VGQGTKGERSYGPGSSSEKAERRRACRERDELPRSPAIRWHPATPCFDKLQLPQNIWAGIGKSANFDRRLQQATPESFTWTTCPIYLCPSYA